MKKSRCLLLACLLTTFLFSFLTRKTIQPLQQNNFIIDTIATNLVVPWDIIFLPDKTMMFTERPGRVRLYRNNKMLDKPALTLKNIEVRGKMGLLGLCIHPDFIKNSFVYLAYNYKQNGKPFVRISRYQFVKDSLADPVTIIENIPAAFNHSGCRLKFGSDKKLYITTGDADMPILSQDLKALNGKTLRLNDDGCIPADNPFANNDTARHEVWTYGHRNSQGMAFQPGTEILFNSEHGPTGGDEINIIEKSLNYGWPIIHHTDVKEGMVSPLLEFSPSIGPAEAIFYSGKAFPGLKGNLLVGCMRGEAILSIKLDKKKVVDYDFLLKNKYGRIRALSEDANGYIYFSTSQIDPPESNAKLGDNGLDMILRIRPAVIEKNASIPTGKYISGKTSSSAQPSTNTAKTEGKKNRSPAILFAQLCASCHGNDVKNKNIPQNLTDNIWVNGGTKKDIAKSINAGAVAKGMPTWEGVLTTKEINQLADYILKLQRR